MDPGSIDRRALLVGALTSAGVAACRIRVEGVDAIDPITPIGTFYVYQCCGEPEVDPASWSLSVRVGGERVASIDRAWLRDHAYDEVELTLECIGANPA